MSSINVKPQGDPSTEYLGAGAVYTGGDASPENWGVTPPTLLGASKGGNSYTDGAEFRERQADADYFPVKDARDLIFMRPQLTTNQLTISTANLEKYFAGMATTVGTTYDKMTRTLDLSSSYIDHVWFIGKNRAGLDIVQRLDDVLGDGAISWNPGKDEEIVLAVQFTAHADPETFDPEDETTFPCALFLEKTT